MKPGGSNRKVANNLVALSSAAVLAVYAAGYVRTRPFADAFDNEAAKRRRPVPITPRPIAPAAQPKAPAPAAPAIPSAPNPVAHEISQTPEPPRTDAPLSLPPATVISRQASPEPASAPAPAPPPAGGPTPQVATTAPVPVTFVAPRPTIAPPAPAPPAAPVPSAPPRWKDGVYFGWGYSRHGDILARVEIEDGRITSATISECKTRYSCSDIDKLPPQVVERQRPDVDSVSGATESADAFIQGVFEALSQAK